MIRSKIELLAQEATTEILGVPVLDQRRFAELIVRECAEVAGCNGHVSGFALGDLIKQHFGVER